MTKTWLVILGLTVGTFSIRLFGVIVGQKLPDSGVAARALRALPGCLIVSLVAVSLLSAGPREWAAGAAATIVAIITRSLIVTMAAGITAIWLIRHFISFL